ncbi:sulfotransferase [Aliiroseovarius sp. YM-037]|uniref:tetratricopeptide repeat-containing sulfotransferase family protein n=1 Tax=Aliiroseovarius sp. YM-037 TaxID=3341728 RepID=UPI003A7F722E
MLPINPSKIPQLYSQALDLQNKGRAKEALAIYQNILQANPKIAEAHFQIGQIRMKALDFESAAKAFGQAAALKPKQPAIWQSYAEALLRLDDATATSAALRQLEASGLPSDTRQKISQRLSNRSGKTKVDTGGIRPERLQDVVRALNAGDAAAAERKVRALLRQHPSVPVLHTMLGGALRQKGDLDGAGKTFRKAIALDGSYAEAYSNYGDLLLSSGDAAGAVEQLEHARSLTPRAPATLANLANAYLSLDRRSIALDLLDRSIKIDPNNPIAYRTRAQIHAKDGLHDKARDDLKKCLALGLKTAQVHQLLAKALAALGDRDASIATIDKAIAMEPKNAAMYSAKATILQSLGDFDAAADIFRQAYEVDPTNGQIYRTFSASHKFTEDDPVLALMEDTYARDDLRQHDRMQLGFALSKAMEDIKAHDRVFTYLNDANRLVREEHKYHISQRRDEVDRMKKAFAGFKPDGHPLTNDSDYAPIFVTGMPRSGTTLIEQILASHSTVTGAGETGRFARQGYGLMLPPSGDRAIGNITRAEISALADDYKAYIETLLPGSDRITDKSIQTYLVMGLVWLSMPNAKVIVVRRDPRDNLLSIYKNVFPDGTHLYSYDLHDLGQYYRMFVEMIDFWRGIAPDRFHEIRYDDLIENPEEESRKLVAAAGLEWEDACLNFHENKRKVDTLSVYQVRQPIYKSSLKAWKRYEAELQPLFDSLGDVLDD